MPSVTLFSPIFQMLKSWLAVDRIRTSPAEGRLLRLRVGHDFILLDEHYTVTARRIESQAEGFRVLLSLQDSNRHFARLKIDVVGARTANAQLLNGRSEQYVADSDVVLLRAGFEVRDSANSEVVT